MHDFIFRFAKYLLQKITKLLFHFEPVLIKYWYC